MKNRFTQWTGIALLLIAGLFSQTSNAQVLEHIQSPAIGADIDACPGLETGYSRQGIPTKAQWDVLMDYNLTTISGSVGCAGVSYYNGNFWVSKWGSDTIVEMTAAGALVTKFIIPGLTGVRALTSNGVYLYAATNSTTVYRIDPATKTLAPPHITVAANARWLTYDATLNAGAGGFWYGNFNTVITSINMTGTMLDTISATTHGLTAMYGAAVDNDSPGGPYLWFFTQGGTNSTQLEVVSIATGTSLPFYSHNVYPDFSVSNSLTSGLAGGLFLSTTYDPGNIALIGVIQGTPNNVLFAYDLDMGVSSTDASVSELRPTKGYTQIPYNQIFPETFDYTIANAGSTILDSVYVDIEVLFNGTPVFNDSDFTTNLNSGATYDFTSAVFTPSNGTGLYQVNASLSLGASQTDEDALNDTMSFEFLVTDTVFARDNGIPDGGTGYSIGSAEWVYITANYTLVADDTIQGIWIQQVTPIDADTTFAVLARTTANYPDSILALGPPVIISSSQFEYFLPFSSPVALAAGTYGFGCYQSRNSSISLAQSNIVWTPDVNYFYLIGSGWILSSIQTARFIRPVFEVGPSFGVNDYNMESQVHLYPNPTQGNLTLSLPVNCPESKIRIYETTGRLIETINTERNIPTVRIDLSAYPAGLYYLLLENDDFSETQKFILQK